MTVGAGGASELPVSTALGLRGILGQKWRVR